MSSGRNHREQSSPTIHKSEAESCKEEGPEMLPSPLHQSSSTVFSDKMVVTLMAFKSLSEWWLFVPPIVLNTVSFVCFVFVWSNSCKLWKNTVVNWNTDAVLVCAAVSMRTFQSMIMSCNYGVFLFSFEFHFYSISPVIIYLYYEKQRKIFLICPRPNWDDIIGSILQLATSINLDCGSMVSYLK